MKEHEFGGDWTLQKLQCLKDYLIIYSQIFHKNPGAMYFKTIYVDAFAGTGYISKRNIADSHLFGNTDRETYLKGSARISLEVEPPFDQYIFTDTNAIHVSELNILASSFPKRNILIENKQANELLISFWKKTNWKINRAVVFLDPYGMQVDWETIAALANTKAIDLWCLFPLGMAINRMLTVGRLPPEKWSDALTRLLGSEEWKTKFYKTFTEHTLFGPHELIKKTATLETIGSYIIERLKTVFTQVAEKPFIMRNSKNNPIFILCFAAGNPKGAPTAVRIAQYIINKEK